MSTPYPIRCSTSVARLPRNLAIASLSYTSPLGDYITVAEAARILGMHRASVGRLIVDGHLPAIKPGHDRLVRRADHRNCPPQGIDNSPNVV